MRPSITKAASVAAQLAVITGHKPRTEEQDGQVRIEVDLPDTLSEFATLAVLTALSGADDYGFEQINGKPFVWAALDPTDE